LTDIVRNFYFILLIYPVICNTAKFQEIIFFRSTHLGNLSYTPVCHRNCMHKLSFPVSVITHSMAYLFALLFIVFIMFCGSVRCQASVTLPATLFTLIFQQHNAPAHRARCEAVVTRTVISQTRRDLPTVLMSILRATRYI